MMSSSIWRGKVIVSKWFWVGVGLKREKVLWFFLGFGQIQVGFGKDLWLERGVLLCCSKANQIMTHVEKGLIACEF